MSRTRREWYDRAREGQGKPFSGWPGSLPALLFGMTKAHSPLATITRNRNGQSQYKFFVLQLASETLGEAPPAIYFL
jgi:hypothetical protein